jgi:hypothetical protein
MQNPSRSVPVARRVSRALPVVLIVLCLAPAAGAQPISIADVMAKSGDPLSGGTLDLFDDWPVGGAFDDDGAAYTVVRNDSGNWEYAVARIDGSSVTPLVKGCNSYGTECHATPIGGGFAHFYWTLTSYQPQLNDAGDLLFRAAVAGLPGMEAWFMRRASGTLESIVAHGSANPLGGVFNNLRNASLGDNGDVVFIGTSNGYTNAEAGVFRWRNGVIAPLLNHGQPSPAGGTYNMLLMANVLPTIDPLGNTAFVGLVTGGPHHLAHVDADGDLQAWMAHDTPTPFGGTWGTSPDTALFNDCGDLIVATDVVYAGSGLAISLVVKRGGDWELLLDSNTILPDGTDIAGVGLPRPPYRGMDDNGNVLTNVSMQHPGGPMLQEALMLVRVDGTMEIVFEDGDPSPDGGLFTADANPAFGEPSLNDAGQAMFAARTSGTGEILARIDGLVPPVGAWGNLGLGLAGASGVPALVGLGLFEAGGSTGLALSGAAPSAPAVLFLGFTAAKQSFKGGVLVPALDLPPIALATAADGSLALGPAPVPGNLPPRLKLFAQVWVQDAGAPAGAAASNALKAVSR